MSQTLAQALKEHQIAPEALDESYGPMLKMFRELIGVFPNCNPVLEIWPPGFRTFNLLVPAMLNLPASLLGQGAPKDLVGMAMYASSNAAQCPYCTAHHCSFAIRRGADPDAVLGQRSETEAAVVELAEVMALVPSKVTPEIIAAAESHLSEEDVEWVALAVSLGGFLNKFMDSMGIPLEEEAVAEVQALLRPSGWDPGNHMWGAELDSDLEQEGRTLASVHQKWTEVDHSSEIPVDGLGTYLRLFRQGPGAARIEKGWTKGVSGRIGPALLMLEEEVGYGFPVLGTIASQKVVKTIATVLRDNLDEDQSRIGLEAKLLAGLVYAGEAKSDLLTSELTLLLDLLVPGISPGKVTAVSRFASAPVQEAVIPAGLGSKESAALMLAKAAAPSPSEITEITVAMVVSVLSPAQIVEVNVWLSILQMLNRWYSYSEVKHLIDEDDQEDQELANLAVAKLT